MKTLDQSAMEIGVRGAPLIWLRLEGFTVFFLSILFYWKTDARWWIFAMLLLVPDVSMVGYFSGPASAQRYTTSFTATSHRCCWQP